jgi:glutamyl/glutaminyl-tRNA synthetase
MEDLDRGRAREEVAASQREDLRWLGLVWDEETTPQSRRTYAMHGLDVYRCACTRASRRAGTPCPCRDETRDEGAWRLRLPAREVVFEDRARGRCVVGPQEDPILMRADGEAAYPLAVVIDDARDGVTEVVRGADLVDATASQLHLYRALGLRPPTWLHVPLLLGPDGKKLSKSHGSVGIAALREAGWAADRVWETLLPLLGLPPGPLPSADALASGAVRFDPSRVLGGPFVVQPDGRVVPAGTSGGPVAAPDAAG